MTLLKQIKTAKRPTKAPEKTTDLFRKPAHISFISFAFVNKFFATAIIRLRMYQTQNVH